MRTLTIALAVTSALVVLGSLYNLNKVVDHTNDTAWTEWKQKFNKSYGDDVTEKHHYGNFKFNQNFIANTPTEGFTLGLTMFADLNETEFKTQFTGVKSAHKYLNRPKNYKYLNVAGATDDVDWRTQNRVTPVRNQGSCGSCWAFSAMASCESSYLFQHSDKQASDVHFSTQQLVDCSDAQGNQGCNGGLMDDAFKYIADNGVETESAYPYTGRNGTCQATSSNKVSDFAYNGFVDVPAKDCSQLQAALQKGPVSVGVDANIFWQLYFGGVMKGQCGSSLDHGVFLVAQGSGAWTIKNSWGSSWGESGFIRLSQSSCSMNSCGLCNQASYLNH